MKAYGITEIADALGIRESTVAQWRYLAKAGRGLKALPAPSEELAMGPVWLAVDIESWIEKERENGRESD